jgi:anti-sigma B factor antagonist
MSQFQRLRLDEVSDVTIVRFLEHRFIDGLEIENLGQELYQLVEGGKRRKLLLDFGAVELFSSAGFGKLISLNGKVRANNGVLRLCNVPPHLADVFRVCRLDRIFDIRKDESDALMAFAS